MGKEISRRRHWQPVLTINHLPLPLPSFPYFAIHKMSCEESLWWRRSNSVHICGLPRPFRANSVPFRASELALPRNSECFGMSTFFRGITETIPSLFRGIFSERNSVPNPSYCNPAIMATWLSYLWSVFSSCGPLLVPDRRRTHQKRDSAAEPLFCTYIRRKGRLGKNP